MSACMQNAYRLASLLSDSGKCRQCKLNYTQNDSVIYKLFLIPCCLMLFLMEEGKQRQREEEKKCRPRK